MRNKECKDLWALSNSMNILTALAVLLQVAMVTGQDTMNEKLRMNCPKAFCRDVSSLVTCSLPMVMCGDGWQNKIRLASGSPPSYDNLCTFSAGQCSFEDIKMETPKQLPYCLCQKNVTHFIFSYGLPVDDSLQDKSFECTSNCFGQNRLLTLSVMKECENIQLQDNPAKCAEDIGKASKATSVKEVLTPLQWVPGFVLTILQILLLH